MILAFIWLVPNRKKEQDVFTEDAADVRRKLTSVELQVAHKKQGDQCKCGAKCEMTFWRYLRCSFSCAAGM